MNAPTLWIALCHALLRAASWIVPRVRRDEWRAEWNAELWTLVHRAERTERHSAARGWRALTFAAGAFAHAVAEFRQEWNADVLWYEVRQAIRALVRHRSYSLTAALLVALGVGANTTVFTLVNAVLLRAPRGIESPDRLVQLGRGGSDSRDFDSWSYPVFVDFRTGSQSFAGLTAFATVNASIGDDADVEPASVQLVSANYFRVLGAPLARGRGFVDEEDVAGAASVVVISDRLWSHRFNLDPNIVGKSLRVRGAEFTIIGVAPPEFSGADVGDARPDLWAPLAANAVVSPGGMGRRDSRFLSWLWIVGRLKPDVQLPAARAELRALFRRLQVEQDGQVRDDILVVPGLGLRPADRALANVISGALLAMVGVVLVVACANLAALLLARGAARETEIGIRLAVGSSRDRLIRQLLIETSIVAVVGSSAAFVLTHWTARFVEWLMPYPIAVSIQPDVRVLVFAVVIGVSTSAVFGILPALRSTRVDLLALLRAGALGITHDRGRLRTALLVGQIALSFILLCATGLLIRTVQRASSSDPGFRTADIFVGEVDLRSGDGAKDEALTRRLEQIAARAAGTPGVLGAALASSVPASGSLSSRTMWRADGERDRRSPSVPYLVVDTGYFHTMGVPMLRGRQFDAALEPRGTPSAVVINETFAKRLWPNEDALGKQLAFGSLDGERHATVIGIARDTRNRSLRSPPAPQAYLLLSQTPTGATLLHVRVAPGHESLANTLPGELRALMVGSPSIRFQSARAWMARSYADVRLISILGGVFGALALALAAAGIYGVVSYETARRQREFGVRLALGARPSHVHAIVLGRSARLSAIGLAIGMTGFALITPLLERWIFGISPFDPLTLVTITAVLAGSAAVATLAPAIRAGRCDPTTSLRAE